ncbi:MAG: sulfatase [Cellulosilyticaceae bacterium]
MKTIVVLFDSLNKRMLEPYGCDWIQTPAFARLAARSKVYDRHYVGSLPCMPARRDLHTGRVNFLHRSWGPLEPYDESMVMMLRQAGVYTHLISDHTHYWEEGGANYHTKYDSWEIVRGQEGDPWVPSLDKPDTAMLWGMRGLYRAQDIVNRKYIKETNQYPIERVFGKGIEFIDANYHKDDWFLQIESFDPHEPFFCEAKYKEPFLVEADREWYDWPTYGKVKEDEETVAKCRKEYASLISACDDYLGQILDRMDRYQMWEDTALIVTTDHGYLLGEHGWWAKTVQPPYNEVAQIPLMIWHPEANDKGERCTDLTQTIDLAPTILEMHGIASGEHMLGRSLLRTADQHREGCLFGIHGCHICVTDGKYVYMRKPMDEQVTVKNYTLQPNHMKKTFSQKEFQTMQLAPPFNFTKGYPLMAFETTPWTTINFEEYGNLLFDLESDPQQLTPITNSSVEEYMLKLMKQLLMENDAPKYIFKRYQMT